MDFSFTSDQQLLKNSARAFLDEHCKPATVRLLWTTRAARARRCGRRWRSSAGSVSRCPKRTAAATSAWSRPRSSSRSSGAPPIPARICRPCSWRPRSTTPAPTRRRTAGCPRSAPAARARRWRCSTASCLGPDAVATRAEKAAGGWKLSGVKPFVAWAHVADVILVPARTPEGSRCSSSSRARPASRRRR